MTLPDQFYISLASYECRKNYHENTGVSFINTLSAPLLFEKSYYVAMTEIYIPPFTIRPVESSLIKRTMQIEQMLGAPHSKRKKPMENESSKASQTDTVKK